MIQGFDGNLIELHLFGILINHKPWLQIPEIGSLSREFSKASRSESGVFERMALSFKNAYSDEMLFYPPQMDDETIRAHIYKMCRDGDFAVRQRVDFGNYQKLAEERYGPGPVADAAAAVLREHLENVVEDDRVHVYRALIHKENFNDHEDGCQCWEIEVTVPEDVIPAPEPLSGEKQPGSRGRPGLVPGWA